ncbi:MAG: recombinase RecA [Clostridia bacterium]|jgi:recombination protein RecA|nr:recombinase RecA [Clostridia bacterium]MCI8944073.1 recombinase RecA [Clostridia bacterium]MCI9290937.1 recombinase RecA [Clostridia bacterium]
MEKDKDKKSAEKEKSELVAEAIAKIEKQYGKGSIIRLGDKEIEPVDVISTGCLTLDMALGVGGLPKGRIVEIYGPESSGKTTVALHAVASCQKEGGMAAFIDAEHALDPIYAEKLGVNVKDLYVSQPDSGEQALDILDTMVRTNAMDIIVVDSVAALTPKAEIEGEMGQSVIGLQARLMSQAMRKLTAVINKTKTCVIFINQLREKVGVMFGNPEVTPGGKALKFYSSIRIEVRKGDAIKDGSDFVGSRAKAKVVKNKVAPPFKTAEFDIIFGKGISANGCLVDMGVAVDVLKKSGSWISYNDEKIGQGREKTIQYLEDNPEVAQEIRAKIMQKAQEE